MPAPSTLFVTLKTLLASVSSMHCLVAAPDRNDFEPIIPRTVSELKALAPRLIMPGHCTGWKATHALARELPEAFVQPSVGTRLLIESGSVSMSE
jgi:7,8-dihydropterin-6-yl-methyl-4-(beta-D-ribofuranosyl)aminobenzene 5'-phosphate synthase